MQDHGEERQDSSQRAGIVDEHDLFSQLVELLSPLVSPRTDPRDSGSSQGHSTPRYNPAPSRDVTPPSRVSTPRTTPGLQSTPSVATPAGLSQCSASPSPPPFPPLLRRGPPSPEPEHQSMLVSSRAALFRHVSGKDSSSSSRTSSSRSPLEGIQEGHVVLEWSQSPTGLLGAAATKEHQSWTECQDPLLDAMAAGVSPSQISALVEAGLQRKLAMREVLSLAPPSLCGAYYIPTGFRCSGTLHSMAGAVSKETGSSDTTRRVGSQDDLWAMEQMLAEEVRQSNRRVAVLTVFRLRPPPTALVKLSTARTDNDLYWYTVL